MAPRLRAKQSRRRPRRSACPRSPLLGPRHRRPL